MSAIGSVTGHGDTGTIERPRCGVLSVAMTKWMTGYKNMMCCALGAVEIRSGRPRVGGTVRPCWRCATRAAAGLNIGWRRYAHAGREHLLREPLRGAPVPKPADGARSVTCPANGTGDLRLAGDAGMPTRCRDIIASRSTAAIE